MAERPVPTQQVPATVAGAAVKMSACVDVTLQREIQYRARNPAAARKTSRSLPAAPFTVRAAMRGGKAVISLFLRWNEGQARQPKERCGGG